MTSANMANEVDCPEHASLAEADRPVVEELLDIQRQAPRAQLEFLGQSTLLRRVNKTIYSHIRGCIERGQSFVATVHGRSCGGCHLTIPVATLLKACSADRVVPCEYCGRILFVPAHETERLRSESTRRRRRRSKA